MKRQTAVAKTNSLPIATEEELTNIFFENFKNLSFFSEIALKLSKSPYFLTFSEFFFLKSNIRL